MAESGVSTRHLVALLQVEVPDDATRADLEDVIRFHLNEGNLSSLEVYDLSAVKIRLLTTQEVPR